VGYGDVSPQTVAGRWLTVFFLPFAVVFVGSQMNAIGDLFSGSNAEGAMEKMLKLDLSAEVLNRKNLFFFCSVKCPLKRTP